MVLKVRAHRISGGNSLRDPPVPIPNTEVKPQHADSTWLATAREGRSPPDSMKDIRKNVLFIAKRRAFDPSCCRALLIVVGKNDRNQATFFCPEI